MVAADKSTTTSSGDGVEVAWGGVVRVVTPTELVSERVGDTGVVSPSVRVVSDKVGDTTVGEDSREEGVIRVVVLVKVLLSWAEATAAKEVSPTARGWETFIVAVEKERTCRQGVFAQMKVKIISEANG